MTAVTWTHMAVVGWALALAIGYLNATLPEHEHPRSQEILVVPECPR